MISLYRHMERVHVYNAAMLLQSHRTNKPLKHLLRFCILSNCFFKSEDADFEK